MSKQEILEGYLNTIYFGRGAYGVQAAAEAFFDKDAKDLDLAERGAGQRPQQPQRLDPANGKDAGRPSRRATTTCSAAWPTRGRHHRRGGRAGSPEAAEVPGDRGREPVRRPEAATC